MAKVDVAGERLFLDDDLLPNFRPLLSASTTNPAEAIAGANPDPNLENAFDGIAPDPLRDLGFNNEGATTEEAQDSLSGRSFVVRLASPDIALGGGGGNALQAAVSRLSPEQAAPVVNAYQQSFSNSKRRQIAARQRSAA